jgi:hypothetical protein
MVYTFREVKLALFKFTYIADDDIPNVNAIYPHIVKGKGHAHNRPQGPKGVPGRLRSRIFLTFGTTRVVGLQPHAPAAFTPRGNP